MTLYQRIAEAVSKLVAVTPVKVSRSSDEMVAGRVRLFTSKTETVDGRTLPVLSVDGRIVSRVVGERLTPGLLAGAHLFAGLRTDGESAWSAAFQRRKAEVASQNISAASQEFREALTALQVETRMRAAGLTDADDTEAAE